jgi:hypothetical protein
LSFLQKLKRSLSNLSSYFKRPPQKQEIVLQYDAVELIADLQRRYPLKPILPSDSMNDLQYRAGQQSVVNTLNQLLARQQQKHME